MCLLISDRISKAVDTEMITPSERLVRALATQLQAAGHRVRLIDALDFDLAGPFKPHFAYARDRAPDQLESLASCIEQADSYVMVSPEYNHAMSPALAHLLNHFGGAPPARSR